MMSNKELKPCPFCGHTPRIECMKRQSGGVGFWLITCGLHCGNRYENPGTKKATIEHWNQIVKLKSPWINIAEDVFTEGEYIGKFHLKAEDHTVHRIIYFDGDNFDHYNIGSYELVGVAPLPAPPEED
jgi:hypothetical protein